MKVIRIEKCGECPYKEGTMFIYEEPEAVRSEKVYVCEHPDAHGHYINDLDIIHPDCPLPDEKE